MIVRRLFFMAVGLVLSLVSAAAFSRVQCGGGWYDFCSTSVGEAYSLCRSKIQAGSDQFCETSAPSPGATSGRYVMNGHTLGGAPTPSYVGLMFGYPVPNCGAAGPWDQQVWSSSDDATASGQTSDKDGCCVSWVHSTSWSYGGQSMVSGTYNRTGSMCIAGVPAAAGADPHKNYKICDGSGSSCYVPDKKMACYGTESGEQVCKSFEPGQPGGCASGATGTLCIGPSGGPPQTPPDPPIPDGQAPNSTVSGSQVTNNVTNNFTQNNYSGTSSGGTGSESGAPGTSGSPGGSGSNQNGNGNSGNKGTGTDGHCPDGKVPTASGCSGTYRDDGCDTPPACYGDAVLCGIAANTHKTACSIKAASGSSTGAPEGTGDGTDNSGDPTGSSVSDSVDAGTAADSLDSNGFGFSASCPIQDLTFTVMGKTVSVPLQDKCDLLGFLRYIVLGLAFFTAAKIIAGVK